THSFNDFLQALKANCLEAFAHQEVPFEQVVERVEKVRDRSRSPIYQVLFGLQNTPETSNLALGNLDLRQEASGLKTSIVDLTFSVTEQTDRLEVGVAYCSDLFSRATIEQMSKHYQYLLQSIVQHPDWAIHDLSMLDKQEKESLLNSGSTLTNVQSKATTLVTLFDQQVAQYPDKIALVDGTQTWTYQQLNEQANLLARLLQHQYLPESAPMVGILMERSAWAILSILGVLKAGAAYVPIDPAYPSERKRYMLEDAQLEVLLALSGKPIDWIGKDHGICFVNKMLNDQAEKLPQLLQKVHPENLAYVIYTSGSTGRPKGVMIEHQAICNTIQSQIRDFGLTSEDHCLQFASLSFDASVWEIFLALLSGAKLYIVGEDQRANPALLEQYVQEQAITFATLPPAYLNELDLNQLRGLKTLVTAGEVANYEKALAFAQLAREAGVPSGALNVVPGLGEEAGAMLAQHPGIDHISFTGSVGVGRIIQSSAAQNIVPVTLELGGKSPQLVFDDADIDAALPFLVNAGIQNAGQTCSASSRILVQRGVYDEVLAKMANAYRSLKVGPAMSDLDVGPLISNRQKTIVQGYLDAGGDLEVIARGEINAEAPSSG
ncbi:MAG: aldehyde dehydrogenase family protein, partial [Bacteroidota bacterium]